MSRHAQPSFNPTQNPPKATIQTLSTAPIESVRLGPIPQGDPFTTAPIVANAIERTSNEEQPTPPKVRKWRVLEKKGFLDKTSGTRATLQAGKEITDQHYNIRDLQRQGVKLQEITDTDDSQPLPTN